MADLIITASQVQPGNARHRHRGIAGAQLVAGDTGYVDAADGNKIKLADNDASLATATVKGVVVNSAETGQPVELQTGDEVTLGAGAAMTIGQTYAQSSTAGGIAPITDLGSADYVTILGVARTAEILKLSIFNSGIQKP